MREKEGVRGREGVREREGGRESVIARASERLDYSALQPNQYKAIKSFLEGKDVFVTLPTGERKILVLCHLCF